MVITIYLKCMDQTPRNSEPWILHDTALHIGLEQWEITLQVRSCDGCPYSLDLTWIFFSNNPERTNCPLIGWELHLPSKMRTQLKMHVRSSKSNTNASLNLKLERFDSHLMDIGCRLFQIRRYIKQKSHTICPEYFKQQQIGTRVV